MTLPSFLCEPTGACKAVGRHSEAGCARGLTLEALPLSGILRESVSNSTCCANVTTRALHAASRAGLAQIFRVNVVACHANGAVGSVGSAALETVADGRALHA